MSDKDDESPKVADLPCPKCGSDTVKIMYRDSCSTSKHECYDAAKAAGWLADSDAWVIPEHFHRTCQRCNHTWPTFDVLSA